MLDDTVLSNIDDRYNTAINALDHIAFSHVTQSTNDHPPERNYGFAIKSQMEMADIDFNISLHDRLVVNDNFMNRRKDASSIAPCYLHRTSH